MTTVREEEDESSIDERDTLEMDVEELFGGEDEGDGDLDN